MHQLMLFLSGFFSCVLIGVSLWYFIEEFPEYQEARNMCKFNDKNIWGRIIVSKVEDETKTLTDWVRETRTLFRNFIGFLIIALTLIGFGVYNGLQ